jgi:parvulin-like peptidyl-prolyl isomerase
VALLVTGLFGCGKGNDWVFSLHGEKLYDTEVRAFGVIYASEHNIISSEQLEETYEGRKTYEDYYKEAFSDDLIETMVLYGEAKEKGVTLSEEEKEEVESKTTALTEKYGDTWLEVKNLTKDDIQEVFEKKALGEAYLKQQTEENEETSSDEEKERYVRVYEVCFPTVKINDDGMVASNQDGTLQNISATEKEEKKQQAEEFSDKAKEGEDMETLLKDYPSDVTGVERVLKYEDLDSTYKKTLEALGKNEISGVFETDYGYYVVKMLEQDDTEHGEKIENYEADTALEAKKDEVLEELMEVYAKDEAEYRNAEKWEDISFSSFLR